MLGSATREAEAEWQVFESARAEAHKHGRRAPLLPRGLVPPAAIALCRLLATTGMRPGEAAGLRWAEIDVASQTMLLDDTKTGRSKRPLGRAAIDVLQSIDRISDEWVFPSRRGEGSSSLKKPLVLLFKYAGIDATPKTLRSTFASVAADLGFSGGTIGEMIGHARQGVTERYYIRRVDAVLADAANHVSETIVQKMAGVKAG